MRASLFAFADTHDFRQDSSGTIFHDLNEEDNVRAYRIEVETQPTFDANGDVVKFDVAYRTQIADYRYVGPTANKAYFRLLEDGDRTFTDIEKAYKHIDAIARKMNRLQLR